jgi:hypothetical protein
MQNRTRTTTSFIIHYPDEEATRLTWRTKKTLPRRDRPPILRSSRKWVNRVLASLRSVVGRLLTIGAKRLFPLGFVPLVWFC